MMRNNRLWILIVSAALAFTSLAAGVAAQEETPSAKEGAAAVVNGEIISSARVERELSGYQARIIRSGKVLDENTIKALKGTIVEKLINQALLYQEAVKQGIKVTDQEVDEQWKMIQEKFATGEELESVLARIKATEEIIRDEIRQVKTVQKFVLENFEKGTSVSEEEARTYYETHPDAFTRPEQVRARHILIQPDPEGGEQAKAEARKKLRDIGKEIQDGADFAELASEHSKCPSSSRGGDLGFFGRGSMAKPFEDAAFALEPGKVSDIVETEFGLHIIKVEERRPEGTVPFEEVKEKLVQYLTREKVKEALGSYLKQLRQDASIEHIEAAGTPAPETGEK